MLKLRHLWCWLSHGFDHAGLSPIDRFTWRCKKCGAVVDVNPWK
jgi:hypothetical protein